MALPIEDVLAILQLVAAYNHAIDRGDGETWADLFAEGGSLDTGTGFVVEGDRAALAAFGSTVPSMVPGIRHVITNLLVEGEPGEGTARLRAYLQVWHHDADAGRSAVMSTGTYDDTLVKVDGEWRFRTRVLTNDTAGPIPG